MSFIINQGFSLKSPQFNFERDYFKDLASLKAASLSDFPDYFVTNVAGVLYVLNKANSEDATTGKWRKLVNSAGNAITIDAKLSATSTNPVQNKVITSALDGKANTAVASQSANGLLSAADKKKLDGIATGGTADSAIDTATIDALFTESTSETA